MLSNSPPNHAGTGRMSDKKELARTAHRQNPEPSDERTQRRQSRRKLSIEGTPPQRRAVSQRKLSNRNIDNRDPVEHYAKRLITQQYRKAQAKNFADANRCKTRIQALRDEVVEDSLHKLKRKHSRQKQRINFAHLDELEELDQFYSKVVRIHKNQSNDKYLRWQRKQHRELRSVQLGSMDKRQPNHVSSEVIALNTIEHQLMEREMYLEAGRIHKELIKAKRRWKCNYEDDQHNKKQALSKNLQRQHSKQYDALLSRIRHSSQQHHLKYLKQREKLQRRYSNVMAQLVRQQSAEIQKLRRSASMLQRFMNESPNNVRWIIQSQELY